jgi:S-adenosylmethionine hydrolase
VALPCIITLTTDFGPGEYVSSLKGVILGINPEAKIIDLSHTVKPQNILQASYIISTTYHYFPDDTIHLVVVDPGVGSRRKAIIVKISSTYFLAPDNGVLSYIPAIFNRRHTAKYKSDSGIVSRRKLPDNIEAVSITNSQYWNKTVSPVFHGRDIFAPVAAHLSLGLPLNNFGPQVNYINILNNISPYRNSDSDIIGKVVHVDNFGNIITNIQKRDIPRGRQTIFIGDRKIPEINRFYAQKEGLIALIGSSGHLEISISNGNASRELGIDIGDEVMLSQAMF